jgi:hypothetical protein
LSAADDLEQPEIGGASAKSILVFLIFLVIGPPLTGFAMLALASAIGGGEFPWLDAATVRRTAAFTVVVSYIFGGWQALAVAFVAAAFQSLTPSQLVPLLPVVLTSAFAGVVFIVVLAIKGGQLPAFGLIVLFFCLHLGAGIGCWLIANILLWPFRRRQTSTQP